MFRFDIITNLAMLIGFAAILGIGVYRREGSVRAAYCVLFCICLGTAYALKLGMADPAESIFMPFHKLYNFSEYGSAGVLDDLFFLCPALSCGRLPFHARVPALQDARRVHRRAFGFALFAHILFA